MASKCNALCVAESMILKFRQKKCPLRNGRGLLIQLLFLDSQKAVFLQFGRESFGIFFRHRTIAPEKMKTAPWVGTLGHFFIL